MPKSKITALTKDQVSAMFEKGICIIARYQDQNHIYIPKGYFDINVRCCCGVISLGPTEARKHQGNCYRYLKYSTGEDYLQSPDKSDYVEDYTPVLSPLTLIQYQKLEEEVKPDRYQGRICLHHHHNDVYACACGERSVNYWGIIYTHHKQCNKGPLEDEYKTIEPTVVTVEHVNSEKQQFKAEKEKIAKDKREKKKKERIEEEAKSESEKMKKKVEKQAKNLETKIKNKAEQEKRKAERILEAARKLEAERILEAERNSTTDVEPAADDESTASEKQNTAKNKKSAKKKKTTPPKKKKSAPTKKKKTTTPKKKKTTITKKRKASTTKKQAQNVSKRRK